MSFKDLTEIFNRRKKDAPAPAQGLTAWFGRRTQQPAKPKTTLAELLHAGEATETQLPGLPMRSSEEVEAETSEGAQAMAETPEPEYINPDEVEKAPMLPHEEFPLHFKAVMEDLERRGQSPGRWDVLKAREVALTEDGMQVEMMMKNADGEDLVFMLVTVCNGKLVGIKVR